MPQGEDNGSEGEGQLIAKKFGAEAVGTTWVKTLLPEFKKPYVDEVRMCVCVCAVMMCICSLVPRATPFFLFFGFH